MIEVYCITLLKNFFSNQVLFYIFIISRCLLNKCTPIAGHEIDVNVAKFVEAEVLCFVIVVHDGYCQIN